MVEGKPESEVCRNVFVTNTAGYTWRLVVVTERKNVIRLCDIELIHKFLMSCGNRDVAEMKTSWPALGATAGRFEGELSQVLEWAFAETWRNGQPERKVGLSQNGKFIRPDRAKRTRHNSSLQTLAGEANEYPGK